jgi:hypothetical protein
MPGEAPREVRLEEVHGGIDVLRREESLPAGRANEVSALTLGGPAPDAQLSVSMAFPQTGPHGAADAGQEAEREVRASRLTTLEPGVIAARRPPSPRRPLPRARWPG